MKKRLDFAIIGTGSIARSYEAAFKGYARARIAAVCDINKDAAQFFGARVGCKSYFAVSDLLRDSHLDAAIICTPPSSHESLAVQLLERGIHVLCEKPVSTEVAGAERMLDAARSNGALFMMASKFRYVSDIRMAKALVDLHAIGELVFVENAFTSRVEMADRWNADPAISGGGVLIDNGTHAVDILRYFLGPLTGVQTTEGRRVQNLPVEDTVRLVVHNRDGVMATSDLSWTIDKGTSTYLRLYGSEGTILLGWNESKYRRAGDADWTLFGRGYNKIHALRSQITNFCEAICGEADLLVTAQDALASVETISAAYAVLKNGSRKQITTQVERPSTCGTLSNQSSNMAI